MENLVGISAFATGYQLGLYWELSATTTRTARKLWTHQGAAKRVREQGNQKKSVECSSDGGAVWKIWWVFRSFRPAIC